MTESFVKLQIDGSIISEFRVVPQRKLVMTLLVRGPSNKNDKAVQAECDLQFNELEHFTIAVQAEPWLQVVSHTVFSESEYLSTFLQTSMVDSEREKLFHFEVMCGQGRFDILAKSFTYSLFNEIPYVQ